MGVDRPDHEGVAVDVDTLGGTAATLDTLRGLTDWQGTRNLGEPFGNGAAFDPAAGLRDAQDRALRIAWRVVGRVEDASGQYAGVSLGRV